MQRGNFNLKWVQFFAYFCVVFFCVTTLPKVGRTNHAVDADATASAQKTGQNSFWATFKGEAKAEVHSPPDSTGVYEIGARVSRGQVPHLTPRPVPFFSSPSGVSKKISKKRTFRAWGSGSNMNFSARSTAQITTDAPGPGSDMDAAYAAYP